MTFFEPVIQLCRLYNNNNIYSGNSYLRAKEGLTKKFWTFLRLVQEIWAQKSRHKVFCLFRFSPFLLFLSRKPHTHTYTHSLSLSPSLSFSLSLTHIVHAQPVLVVFFARNWQVTSSHTQSATLLWQRWMIRESNMVMNILNNGKKLQHWVQV